MDKPNKNFWQGRNVLITGVSGFVGSWLAERLSNEYDVNVSGLIRRQSNPNVRNIQHLIDEKKINLIRGDLHDIGSLANAMKESKAEVVFHLAAQSFVPHSFASPAETYLTNVMGTINVLETIKILNKDIMMHFAGSSEEYGLVIANHDHYLDMIKRYKIILPPPQFNEEGKAITELPIKETNPTRSVGTSPYGSSKRMAEDACKTYVSCYDMKIFITRAFNHTGPRRGNEFVTSQICSQVAEGIKYDRKDIILGNLVSIRDFNDVRDIINGYLMVIEKGEPGNVCNLCSGVGRSIKEVKDLAIKIGIEKFGLKNELEYKLDSSRLRSSDLPILIGCNTKAKEKLGWCPNIPFEKTLEDMIQFFLERI